MIKKLLIFFIILFASTSFADEVQIQSDIGLQNNSLGYQEHTDLQVGGVTHNIDSTCSPSYLSLQSRVELRSGKKIYGIKGIIPVSKSTAQEKWTIDGTEYQTNDLSYSISSVDIYAGYEFNTLLGVVGGARISRGLQTRHNFFSTTDGALPGVSTEIIDSFNIFSRMFGSTQYDLYTLGYALEVSYPLSASATNNFDPGINFNSSGYSLGMGVCLSYKLVEDSTIKLSTGYNIINYDGSQGIKVGADIYKWPSNKTQDFFVALSMICGY